MFEKKRLKVLAGGLVLSMFAIEGLPHGEIADVLGVPEGTVWSRLSAARERLAEELRATRR